MNEQTKQRGRKLLSAGGMGILSGIIFQACIGKGGDDPVPLPADAQTEDAAPATADAGPSADAAPTADGE